MPLQTMVQQHEVEVAYSDDDSVGSSVFDTNAFPLVDADTALEITKDVAEGYIILLSGGNITAQTIKNRKLEQGKKASKSSFAPTAISLVDSNSINFAFAALTDGNVIEAAFGVESNGGLKRSRNTSETAYNNARNAKQALMDACMSSESIKKLAVETYIRLFEIIIELHIDLETIGFITWCMKHQKIQSTALKKVYKAFSPLSEAIASSI